MKIDKKKCIQIKLVIKYGKTFSLTHCVWFCSGLNFNLLQCTRDLK